MPDPIIRLARVDEYDDIGRVWMESWVSTGLDEASNFLLANLRARVRKEVADGWRLYVADDDGTLAAMLALHLEKRYLDQASLFIDRRGHQAADSGVPCRVNFGRLCAGVVVGRYPAATQGLSRFAAESGPRRAVERPHRG